MVGRAAVPVMAPRIHLPAAVHIVLVRCASIRKPAFLGRNLRALPEMFQPRHSSTINCVGTFPRTELLSHRRSAISKA